MTQRRRAESLLTREFKVSPEVSMLVVLAFFLPLMAAAVTFTGSASYWPSWGLPVLWTLSVFLVVVVVSVIVVKYRKEQARYTQVGGPVLSWQAAEQMAANHMRAYGFADARTTRGGSDGGIDVVSRWGVAQVKFYSNPVGRPDVQKLRGAAHGQERVLFYAMSGFNQNAIDFADQARVALFQFDQRGMVWPVNGLAKAYRKPQQAAEPKPAATPGDEWMDIFKPT